VNLEAEPAGSPVINGPPQAGEEDDKPHLLAPGGYCLLRGLMPTTVHHYVGETGEIRGRRSNSLVGEMDHPNRARISLVSAGMQPHPHEAF